MMQTQGTIDGCQSSCQLALNHFEVRRFEFILNSFRGDIIPPPPNCTHTHTHTHTHARVTHTEGNYKKTLYTQGVSTHVLQVFGNGLVASEQPHINDGHACLTFSFVPGNGKTG